MTTPTAPASGGTAAPAVVTVGADAVWLPPGAPPVLVGGYAIAGGLCYVGAGLGAAYAATPEPALLDPGVPVRRVRLDQETPAEGVRPAYTELTPGARAAYLEWLAGGRVGPTLPVHLWLFLYGLERRVLVDLAGAPEWQEEYAAIAAELTTLRERYPAAVAFDEQAGELAALLETLAILGDPALQPPPVGPRTGELPMPLRVGLARYLAHGRPLPAAWAYCWYAYSDERRWGTAATRWPTEFRRTFETVYTHAHPGGMVVPAPPDELVLAYRPASPGFAGRTVRLHTTLPDVQRLADPLRELGELAARAEADLVAARGRVGPVPTTRRPPPPDRPAPAWPIPGSPEPDLSAPVPSAPMPSAPVPSAPMPEWPVPQAGARPAAGGRPPPEEAVAAGQALFAALWPGREVREPAETVVAGPVVTGSVVPGSVVDEPAPDPVVVETIVVDPVVVEGVAAGPVGGGAAPRADGRPQLAAAEAVMRLVALSGIEDVYVRAVRRHVVDALGLTLAERHRVDDSVHAGSRARPDRAAIRSRYAALRPAEQQSVAELLIAVVGANGLVEPGHAAVLGVVFDLLGPGRADLHRRLHELEVAAVVEESSVDATALDADLVERAIGSAAVTASIVDDIVAARATTAAGSVISPGAR